MDDYFDHVCLTIAGSDSGGGAGIQADLHTFAALGCFGTSAITAVTAQNTRAVTQVQVLTPDMVEAQIRAVLNDFPVAAIKLGMLADSATVETVAECLKDTHCPIVLDPVMIASSGAQLLSNDAVEALKQCLLPLASVLTPNIDEAVLLLGEEGIDGIDAAAAAGERLRQMGPRQILMKGAHLAGSAVTDQLINADGRKQWQHPRVDGEGHGTGCSLAAAVAAGLAKGYSTTEACDQAIRYVAGALRHGKAVGKGAPIVLHHQWQSVGVSD
jgi:hydroxymethylpyrimidine/phosphomethylpyrimidine kinase